MARLATCSECRGFVPASQAVCPNCGSAVSAPSALARAGKGLLAAAGGGIAAITLAACYGPGALCNYPDGGTSTAPACTEQCIYPVDGGAAICTQPDAGNTDAGYVDAGPTDGG